MKPDSSASPLPLALPDNDPNDVYSASVDLATKTACTAAAALSRAQLLIKATEDARRAELAERQQLDAEVRFHSSHSGVCGWLDTRGLQHNTPFQPFVPQHQQAHQAPPPLPSLNHPPLQIKKLQVGRYDEASMAAFREQQASVSGAGEEGAAGSRDAPSRLATTDPANRNLAAAAAAALATFPNIQVSERGHRPLPLLLTTSHLVHACLAQPLPPPCPQGLDGELGLVSTAEAARQQKMLEQFSLFLQGTHPQTNANMFMGRVSSRARPGEDERRGRRGGGTRGVVRRARRAGMIKYVCTMYRTSELQCRINNLCCPHAAPRSKYSHKPLQH